MENKIYEKIVSKKEFSKLPKKDVELAFAHFEKREVSDEEKIRLTRDLLHRVFASFASVKILSPKNKDENWILRKHLSTRERLPFYEKVYERIFKNFKGKNVIDFGSGINGFSYNYFSRKVNYFGVEAVGQLGNLTNDYFEKNKISGKILHESLFDLKKIEKLILEINGEKIVFLFKVVDCLEMLERNYSKNLLRKIVPLVSQVVVSFATRSLVSKKKFKVNRKWFFDFVKNEFNLVNDFEIGGERYVVIENRT